MFHDSMGQDIAHGWCGVCYILGVVVHLFEVGLVDINTLIGGGSGNIGRKYIDGPFWMLDEVRVYIMRGYILVVDAMAIDANKGIDGKIE